MPARPRVLVLGARGLLGSSLLPYLQRNGYDALAHARTENGDIVADLTDPSQVTAALGKAHPVIVVNLVALTNVDECERNPRQAYHVNVRTVENIVNWMRAAGNSCHLVQISTDQVYDGAGPHREEDPSPSNYYGFSKLAGELVAGQVPSTILRTNFFGPSECPQRVSFSDWLVESLRHRRPITVFDDVRFSPLSLPRLVSLIELAMVKRQRGVFNLGSRDGMSKADFAFDLARVTGLSTERVSRGGSAQVPLLAYRPKDMTMDSSRFERAFGVTLPSLRDEIQSVKAAYAS
jgi:dTDP-4-dehydrorhamnose reductase